MLGLNDHYIPRHPPPGFGKGAIGHELGDAEYTLRRRPDLVAFCGARGNRDPCFHGGRGMVRRNEFKRGYQVVRLQGFPRGPVGDIHFLREGGPLGMRRSDDRIEIPGYFFAQGPAVALLDGTSLVTEITADAPAVIEKLTVDSGTWEMTAEPAADLDVAFACHGTSAAVSSGPSNRIRLDAPVDLDVVLGVKRSAPGSVLLRRVVLERVPGGDAGFSCSARVRSGPVVRVLSDVATPPSRGRYWAAPEIIRFGRAGARVDLPRITHALKVELSTDGNDDYVLQFLLEGRLKGIARMEAFGQPGLQTQTVESPMPVTRDGCDAIVVRPGKGDGSFSLGHLTVTE